MHTLWLGLLLAQIGSPTRSHRSLWRGVEAGPATPIRNRILSEVSPQYGAKLEEVGALSCGTRGEHFRKNCVGRNRGVGLWRLNQRVILVTATGGGIGERRM